MATIADILLTGTAFQNINTASGLIAGTSLVIQNKSSADVYLVISPTQPLASSENGWLLESRHSVQIQNETDIVWARSKSIGSNHISVQQLN